jgi:hypothetical protein
VIELFSQHGVKFIDSNFLPDLSFNYLFDLSDETAPDSRKYSVTWRRARSVSLSLLSDHLLTSDLFDNKSLCIFPSPIDTCISPSTICKGPLSNKIFLETICSLCEYPAILQVHSS